MCISNSHLRGVPVLFGYETTGKPRGTGAPAATRRRPREGGRLDHGGCPAARMIPQFGHPVAGCGRSTWPRGPYGPARARPPPQIDGPTTGETAPPLSSRGPPPGPLGRTVAPPADPH